ncbi:MAG: hypothetical protein Wins2KO_22350 [Winogradskyella sp.]
MNKKVIYLFFIVVLLLAAFITNPTKEKHLENATEFLMKESGADNSGIQGLFLESFSTEVARSKTEIYNYYFFSISYVYSNERNKTMNLGLGIFGQVIPLVNDKSFEEYKSGIEINNEVEKKKPKKEVGPETQKKLDDLIG